MASDDDKNFADGVTWFWTRLFPVALVIGLGLIWWGAARAECLQWGRTLNGNNRVCMMDDAVNRNPVVPESSLAPPEGSCITCGTVTSTATPFSSRCDDGWTVVVDSSMRPMCARELRKPQ